MSEVANEQVVEQVEQNTPQISEIEQKAIELGWKPKDQFHGDEVQFIDAGEFIRRQPLFDKIEHMGRELKETRKVLQMLQEHHKKVKETEFTNALNELKAEKKRALEEGDADRLLQVDDAIAEVRTAQIQQNQVNQQQQEDPRFSAWKSANRWYTADAEMRTFADAVGLQYADRNPGTAPEEVLQYVEKRVKSAFKEKFENPNRTKPSSVEGSNSPAGKSTSKDDFVLTEEERKVMNTFVRSNIMTKDEYIAELKKVRG